MMAVNAVKINPDFRFWDMLFIIFVGPIISLLTLPIFLLIGLSPRTLTILGLINIVLFFVLGFHWWLIIPLIYLVLAWLIVIGLTEL